MRSVTKKISPRPKQVIVIKPIPKLVRDQLEHLALLDLLTFIPSK